MGKYKRLKKLMEAEVEIAHNRMNKLTFELAEIKREAAKNLHPSTMTPEARNWCDVVDKEYKAAVQAAVDRANAEYKPTKRVLFKRVKNELVGDKFLVTPAQLDLLGKAGVPVRLLGMSSAVNPTTKVGVFTPFCTSRDVSELTFFVNSLFEGKFKFYAEVNNA